MNMIKKNGGFTLVELIVVIAILAILAGIALPAYSGYIDRAREAGDTQIISAVNTAIQAATAANKAEVASASYDGAINITFSGEDKTQAEKDYQLYMSGNSTKLEYYNEVDLNDKGLVEGKKTN